MANLTAEDIRARIAQASGGLTADRVRARIAQAPGAAVPVVTEQDDRTFMQKLSGAAAGFLEPLVRTAQGVEDLLGTAGPEAEANYETTLGEIERQKLPGARGAMTNIAGEVVLTAFPASKAYRLTKALSKARPITGKIAPIMAESAAVGGMEGLKTPEEGETRGGNVASGALGNLAGGAIQTGISRAVVPKMFRRTEAAKIEAQELVKAGIEPDIPLSLGSEATGPVSNFTRWMQRQPLRATPGFKKILNRQVEKSLGDWREVMIRKALPEGAEVPMPRTRGGESPVDDTLDAANDWYSKQYKEVLDPYSFDVMTDASPVGGRINTVITNIPGKGPQRVVGQKLGDLFGKYVEEGSISGANVSALKTALRREAKLAQDGVVKKAYYDTINALSEGVEAGIKAVSPGGHLRRVPDVAPIVRFRDAARYAALRTPYRNFITLDDAAGRVKKGEFSPEDLFSAGQRKARSEKINPRRAPYRQESQRAAEVYDINPKERESNIFQLGALAGITGFGGVAAPGVTAGVWAPVLASMPRGGQKYMMGELPIQQALSELLRKPMTEEMSRALRIGGGQYLAE